MHDVFISYSHKDEKIREAVCQKLESEGIKCWYAPRDIQPGGEWADAITLALKQCKVMILIFTDRSNNSAQVLREVGLAVDFRKKIIPFNCDESVPTGSMQYYLSTLHWLDASEDSEAPLDDLTELTKKYLSGEQETKNQVPPEPKGTISKKTLLIIISILVLLNAGLIFFLYSRDYIGKRRTPEEIQVDDMIADLIDEGVTAATGEDLRSIDFSNVMKWVVVNNKLYYFSSGNDSPDTGNYLYTLQDDDTIMLDHYNGTGKTEIILPEMIDGLPVTAIGESCFGNNLEIEKVTFSDTVDYISANAFSGCTNLHETVFPETLIAIDKEAFAESGLIEVILPDTVTQIGEGVFMNCEQLEYVFLPEELKIIPHRVFQNTPALQSVTIAAPKPLIDSDAFDPETAATLIGYSGSYTEKYAQQKGFDFTPYEPSDQ